MNASDFRSLTREAFAYLETDYGFSFSTDQLGTDLDRVTFVGPRTFVQIKLDHREPQIFVDIGRVRNGQVAPYPVFVEDEERLERFDVLDLLHLRASDFPDDEGRLRGLRRKREVKRKLQQFANLLLEHGDDVLRGDLSVFENLETLVRDRAGLLA